MFEVPDIDNAEEVVVDGDTVREDKEPKIVKSKKKAAKKKTAKETKEKDNAA